MRSDPRSRRFFAGLPQYKDFCRAKEIFRQKSCLELVAKGLEGYRSGGPGWFLAQHRTSVSGGVLVLARNLGGGEAAQGWKEGL